MEAGGPPRGSQGQGEAAAPRCPNLPAPTRWRGGPGERTSSGQAGRPESRAMAEEQDPGGARRRRGRCSPTCTSGHHGAGLPAPAARRTRPSSSSFFRQRLPGGFALPRLRDRVRFLRAFRLRDAGRLPARRAPAPHAPQPPPGTASVAPRTCSSWLRRCPQTQTLRSS